MEVRVVQLEMMVEVEKQMGRSGTRTGEPGVTVTTS